MQLTSFTDYGLRALIYLAALPAGQLTTISTITEVYGLSRNHMVKIINKLAQCGYVATSRGKNGGICLNRSPDEISIGSVIRSLEPLRLVDCSSDACLISSACNLGNVLANAVNVFLQELDQYTLANVVDGNTPLLTLFGIPVVSTNHLRH